VLSGFAYTLNDAGIRTGVTEADGSQVSYAYDGLYKLTGETRTGANPYTITYTYDNVGNRLTQVKDGVSTSYAYNSRDQLVAENSQLVTCNYVYDHAGRQTSKTDASGTTNYTWIDNDRMVSVSGPATAFTYEYDAEGRRVSEATAGSTKNYLIDAQLPYGQVIVETDGSGNPVVSYAYGQDRISMTRGSGTHYYLADGQGSIRALTDGVGNVTDSWTYSAFGEVVGRTGTTENAFTYTGEQWDPNAGFYYLRARWYNPTTGTFTSVDPWKGKVGAPITLHRYLYCRDNPINRRDPSGEMCLAEVMPTSIIQSIVATLPTITLGGVVRGIQLAAAVGLTMLGEKAIEKAIDWERTSRDEPPIRLQHYTPEEGVTAIEACGYILAPSGQNFFSPEVYTSSSVAANKNATHREPDFYISINLFRKADNLLGPQIVEPKVWQVGGKTIIRSGGGWEYWNFQPVYINGFRRARSQWIPLTD
jgi:RHS repeat-associated protein